MRTMQYSAFHLEHGDILESAETALRDTDGTRLYESWDSGLLSWIIHFNDVPRLKQYLSVYKSLNLDREEDVCFDPLEVAAQAGSTDALAVLVEHYYKTTSTNKPLNRRKHSLLSAASSGPHLGTAQFILGLQPTPHSVDFNQSHRDEALLAAAGALNHLPPEVREHETPIDLDQWRCDLIARGEKLIHLLLDNGASAQVIDLPTDERQCPSRILCGGNAIKNDDESQSFQSFGTTLGLASSRAGSTLVKRLIHQGANIHVKEQYQYYSASHFWFDTRIPWNVTSLHISSMYWNTEALQTLLDHWGRDTTESLSSRDSNGRLPLHWAAAGPGSHECWLSDIHVKDRIIDTLKLVLTGSDINARDDLGANALHHAISGHASCSGSKHFSALIKFLLDNGAEADVVDKNGQTVLHRFASNCRGEPIDISLMETLLLRGAKINQQDKNGNTVLHRMVTDLQQVQAVKFLISRGIDISIVDSRGNTALHHCLHSGSILDRETSTGLVLPTFADQRRALDEMREILLEAGGHNMMDQPNLRGETPRQFQFNRLQRWRRAEFPHLFPKPAGRGRPIRNDFVKS